MRKVNCEKKPPVWFISAHNELVITTCTVNCSTFYCWNTQNCMSVVWLTFINTVIELLNRQLSGHFFVTCKQRQRKNATQNGKKKQSIPQLHYMPFNFYIIQIYYLSANDNKWTNKEKKGNIFAAAAAD